MSDGTGPGKRLTVEQEQRGAELYAAGASERDVADELGCSASTAHRLRLRLQEAAPAAPAATEAAGPGTSEATVTPEPGETAEAVTAPPGLELTGVLPPSDAEIAALRKERDETAEAVATYEARAQESRTAIVQLETDRREVLAAGHDAAPLRPRLRDAADDLKDSEEAAALARDYLQLLDARLAAIEAREDLARARSELEGAVALRDEVCGRTGDRMRAAVLAVAEAAREFTAALADDQAVVHRAEQLAAAVAAGAAALGEPAPVLPPAPCTALSVPGDLVAPGPVHLSRALYQAREGNVQRVATELGEAFGWLPVDPALIAAEHARLIAMRAGEAAPVAPGLPAQIPPGWGASVSVDQHGNPLQPPDPERPRPPEVARPGSLGFQPWPE